MPPRGTLAQAQALGVPGGCVSRAIPRRRDLSLDRWRAFRMNASRPMKTASVDPRLASTREDQASSNVRAVSCVRRSIRPGGSPIWKTMPGFEKSASVTPARGAPKSASALSHAMVGEGAQQIDKVLIHPGPHREGATVPC